MGEQRRVVCLDWRDAKHWSRQSASCVHCGRPTNLRDDAGRASHKICAERLLGIPWAEQTAADKAARAARAGGPARTVGTFDYDTGSGSG